MAITFEELGLNEDILKGLKKLEFTNATPIQEQSIPFLLEKENDLIALAQTGTGKTAAFSLPILQKCDLENRSTQAMILSPTRELCLQICNDIAAFSKYMPGLSVLAVYGGSSISDQIRALKSGAQIVVGTPGRTVDLINRKKLKLEDINYLVLDEADEMLSMGFKDSLDAILDVTSDNRQTVLFSATMPKEIKRISKKYMNDPHEISVVTDNKSTTNVSHEYYVTYEKNRYEVLKRLADINPNIYSIVFCRTRLETQKVADKLIQDGYSAESIHGDLSQAQRDHVMKKFRKKKVQMLVATDVAARGIDVNDLTHVINYNLPDSLEAYVHRSGRTGRADKKGTCITIINARENGRIRQVEKKIGRKFDLKQVPSGKEVCGIQMMKLIENVKNVHVDEDEIGQFSDQITASLEDLSREELIKKFVSMEFNRFLEYYKNAGDLNATPGRSRDRDNGRERGRRGDRDRRGGRNSNYSRFFINIGKLQNLNPKDLIVLINKTMKGKTFGIGEIDLQKNFSFFEVDKGFEEDVVRKFRGVKYKGVKVNVEVANPKGSSSKSKGKKSHRKGGKKGRRF